MKSVKITYWIKAAFLVLSWLILFNGLEGKEIDGVTFFTSLLIYTGAVVFDLIFLCIETNAKTNILTEGIYKGSLFLVIVNGLLAIFELIGAVRGIEIVIGESQQLVMKIADNGIVRVFSELDNIEFKIKYFMLLILVFGLFSILPGLFLIHAKDKYQKKNQS